MLLKSGFLVATLILSIKTGLILGTSWLSRKAVVLVSSLFGAVLFLLAKTFAAHQKLLVSLLDRYTFAGAVMAAILLIYLGLQESEPAGGGEERNKRKLVWLSFLPCPFCLAALAFSVIMLAPTAGVGISILGAGTAVVFTLLVIGVALGTRMLLKLTKFRPITVFNQLLFFMGALTLAFSLLIPNFVRGMTMPLEPVEVASPVLLGWVVMGFVGLTLLGYFRYQKNCLKKGDDCGYSRF